MSELTVIDLGLCSYQRALDIQLALWQRVADGEDVAFLVLVEHDPPVITMGRRSQPEHLLAGRERLAQAGVELHEVSRGGSVTWHGRGQLVAYPILRLTGRAGGLHGYIRDLEETVIRVAAQYGVSAGRSAGATGVWVGREKLAAIGVAVKKWVTYHGLAMNICPDFKGFDLIVPCGLGDRGVTSLCRLTGRDITVQEVKSQVVQAFADVLEFEVTTYSSAKFRFYEIVRITADHPRIDRPLAHRVGIVVGMSEPDSLNRRDYAVHVNDYRETFALPEDTLETTGLFGTQQDVVSRGLRSTRRG